jgi:hypothetical protein
MRLLMLGAALAWGGPVVRHFGHQVAEFSMRIVSSLAAHPDTHIAFASHPSRIYDRRESIVPWTWDVWRWLGLAREKVVFITSPTLCAELFVAPQAEQLGVGPTAGHLDRMNALVERRLGPIRPGGVLFVSRAGVGARFAGEAYLEAILRKCGVTVLRPEERPIRDQLRAYATASMLVFSEGSALHALQLLGRLPSDVLVVVRRPGQRLAEPNLLPRTRSLTYQEVSSGVLAAAYPNGSLNLAQGLSIADGERMLDALRPVVPGLDRRFRSDAYRAAQEKDVVRWMTWLASVAPRSFGPGAQEALLTSLDASGFGHLRPTALRIAAIHGGSA